MLFSNFKIQEVKGETEHVSYRGKRERKPTVLIRVGKWSMSKKALTLGLLLAVCQIWDGTLTYVGLHLLGVQMEGNAFLRSLMIAYGKAPVLVGAKIFALTLVGILTFSAHRRRWIRPVIAMLVSVYLCLAVIPWVYIISATTAKRSTEHTEAEP